MALPARKPEFEPRDDPNYWNPQVIESGGEGDGQPSGKLRAAGDDEEPESKDEQSKETEPSLYERESQPDNNDVESNPVDNAERQQVGDEDSGLYQPDGRQKKSAKSQIAGAFAGKRKWGWIGGGFIAGILSLVVIFVQGPFQFVQLSQMLDKNWDGLELMSDVRNPKMLRALRAHPNPVAGSRLGVVANRAANLFEARLAQDGIRLIYEGSGAYLNAVEIDGVRIDLEGNNAARRQQFRSIVSERLAWNKVATAIAARPTLKRYGINLKPLGNILRRNSETLDEWKERIRQEKDDRVSNPDYDFNENRARERVEEQVRQELGPDATDEDVANAVAERLAAEGIDVDIEEAITATEQAKETYDATPGSHDVKFAAAANRLTSVATRGGIAVMLIGLTCLIQELGGAGVQSEFENVYLPTMRMAGDALAIGAQVQASDGGITAEELAIHAENLSDGETSWAASAAITALSNPNVTQTLANSVQDTYQVGQAEKNSMTQFFSTLSTVTGFTGLGLLTANTGICGWLANSFVSGLLTIVEYGVTAVAAFFSGGAAAAGYIALKTAATALIKNLVEDVVVSTVLNQGTKQALEHMLIGTVVASNSSGQLYGDIVAVGANYMANESGRDVGGYSLSPEEEFALNQELIEYRKEDSRRRGFAYRYLDLDNGQSLIASTIKGMESVDFKKPVSTIASINPFKPVLAALLPGETVYAQSTSDILGSPKIAFSLGEINSTIAEDPIANEEYVIENNLAETYEDCFVSPWDQYRGGDLEEGYYLSPQTTSDPVCQDESDQDLLRYRIYKFDLHNTLALACQVGDDTACSELGYTTGGQ